MILRRLGFAVLALSVAAPVAAQVGDTIPPPDSLAADSLAAQDTIPGLAPLLVPLGTPDSVSMPSIGLWVFDRVEMQRLPVFTLADLVARVPGITPYRTGLVLQPEAAGAFGGAGGRIEILRDGFPLDPLDASAPDLARISLIDAEEIRIERRPGLLRIHIRTPELPDDRPYSRVEAGLAQPQIEMFRGLFMAPNFLLGPITFGVERLETGARDQPADDFVGWARWGWVRENRGIVGEFWQSGLRRDPNSPWLSDHQRRDVIVRARNRFRPGVVAEAYAGWSSIEVEDLSERVAADSIFPRTFERSSRQIGGRVAVERGPLSGRASIRHRSGAALPTLEIEAEAAGHVLNDRLTAGGGILRQQWRDVDATMSLRAHASARVLSFLDAFAEIERGTRGLPTYRNAREEAALEAGGVESLSAIPVRSELTSLRAGVEIDWWRMRGGGAFIDHSVDSVAVFGLPFDSTFRAFPGGDARAWEAWGRFDLVRFWGGALFAEGSWQSWFSGTGWVYRPAARGTGGLGLHISPLPTGNLEVRGRLWLDHRGQTAYPSLENGLPALAALPARSVVNADLLIRIIDVTIFAQLQDWRAQGLTDVPDRTITGPRLFYGVRWHFRN